ncbi:MAG: hypothetical protein WCD76_00410 [Pyrinomonadaceae bacterium]
MIVILASRQDAVARLLAARWAHEGAELLTPEGLSVEGWRHYVATDGDEAAVIGGRRVATCDIEGVVSRLWGIGENDLPHIVAEDRSYISMEMTAFLTSWLSSLRCPVLNRPLPMSLAGPNWRREEWIHRAARLGIPVRPLQRRSTPDAPLAQDSRPENLNAVTVAGNACPGTADETLKVHALRLARSVGASLLNVHFDGDTADAAFVSADVWPDVSAPLVADAILEHFKGGGTC